MTHPPSGQGHWPQPPQHQPGTNNQTSGQQPANPQQPNSSQQPRPAGPWIAPQHPSPHRNNAWATQPQQSSTGQGAPAQPAAAPTTAAAPTVMHSPTPPNYLAGHDPHTQPPEPRKPKWPWVLLAGLVVVVLFSTCVYFLLRPTVEALVAGSPSPTHSGQEQAGAATSAPEGDSGGSNVQPSSAASTPAVETDPGKRLVQIKDEDSKVAQADLKDRWVPQLSSKQEGLKAEGKTWTLEDILKEHEQLREYHPQAKLLWSGDWASFQNDDFWVTVVGIGYTDKKDALNWCRSNGLDADHCYAKKLTTSGGTDGTVYRG